MDSRRFFNSNNWWGKLIGAFFGFLMAGPAGALFGILIGNFFDRGLAIHFSKPHWSYHTEKRRAVQKIFLETTFAVMGHLAKANGRVSESVIEAAKTIMQELGLSRAQKKNAEALFIQGKNPRFQLAPSVLSFQRAAYNNNDLIRLFIDIQYRIAKVDGFTSKTQTQLNEVLSLLGFAPLNKQARFYEDFFHDSTYRQTNQQSYSSSSSNNQRRYHTPPNLLDHAYAILEVSPTIGKQDLKKAYRRLMSRNHPDKLIAKGLSEAMIKNANEKTQKIRKAYEQICAHKGW